MIHYLYQKEVIFVKFVEITKSAKITINQMKLTTKLKNATVVKKRKMYVSS